MKDNERTSWPESTLQPLTIIPLTLIMAFAGGVFWFASLYAATSDNSRAIEEVKSKQEIYVNYIKDISERLARIEERLNARHHN